MLYKSKLPILAREVRQNDIDFSDITLFVVHHIKENVVEFIRLLSLVGFKKIVVIGKPYSRNEVAEKEFKKYAEVIVPPFEELEKPTFISLFIKRHLSSTDKCICFDMSGYFSRYFTQNAPPKGLLGVIEETKNGIWFEENYQFKFPMLSVASAILKNYGETYFVAKAIMRTSEHILINERQLTLAGHNILIVGYGSIGRHLAYFLRTQATVSIYDIKPPLRLRACVEGHSVLPNLKNLKKFDFIIGVTGSYPLQRELLQLKQDVILINGSTGKREFAFNPIKKSIINVIKTQSISTITLKNKRRIHLLAHGYPVNFFQSESIPSYIFDIVCAETFILAQLLAKSKFKPGYYPIEKYAPDVENRVANAWLDLWSK
ncbi:MAG: hypothetical protein US50_C0068G0003 [Candidatus Nomurabacteria bacterium GW2011_GWB1_37_5]|uniref:S-adenosyl-L-homocysteine hydrolase NAD binding domain-containing protein n=1 Tax=Candidatus Nomurabacteria bacterium GW2011_GWB1_37_5 TaxID=1618742 RepID=A0A0G0JZW4_9BACT|nr:MAG: hypothetical protein US50_C0068G0003 [Candidatus Nomurabacteria bacterium GW2011_GWB1_37_5]